ncbi:ORF-57 [Teiidae poxvirus 1]|nr:ORF-57 [Teiidae poxvirus 1]
MPERVFPCIRKSLQHSADNAVRTSAAPPVNFRSRYRPYLFYTRSRRQLVSGFSTRRTCFIVNFVLLHKRKTITAARCSVHIVIFHRRKNARCSVHIVIFHRRYRRTDFSVEFVIFHTGLLLRRFLFSDSSSSSQLWFYYRRSRCYSGEGRSR